MYIAIPKTAPVIREPTTLSFVLRDGYRGMIGSLLLGGLVPSLEPPLEGIRQGRRHRGPHTPAWDEGSD